jgi:dienelactone hydrolase
MEQNNTCCPKKSHGAMKPVPGHRGSEYQIAGNLNLYHVGQGNKAIIFIHDIYGIDSGRSRLVADEFAAQGYQVFFPDLLRGDTFPDNGKFDGFGEWLKKHPVMRVTDDVINYVVPHAKSKGVTSIGLIGFCWGTYVMTHLSLRHPEFKAVVHPHPAYQIFSMLGEDGPTALSKVTIPQFYMPAGNDDVGLKPNGALIALLKKNLGEKVKSVEFPKMQHGWFVRGDLADPQTATDCKETFRLSIEFFNKYI